MSDLGLNSRRGRRVEPRVLGTWFCTTCRRLAWRERASRRFLMLFPLYRWLAGRLQCRPIICPDCGGNAEEVLHGA